MKAFRATKSSSGSVCLALENVPIPKSDDQHVIVKIKASPIQPSDILNAKGTFEHTTFPRTLGRDFAGVVVEGPSHLLNKEVFGTSGHNFSFTIDGAHAEYAAVPIDGICIKPASLSWIQASLLGVPSSTALSILNRSNVKSGESVVVLGATGSVGSWMVWLAKSISCHVITVGRHGTDINSTDDPELKGVKGLTDGKGANVVVDTVGDVKLTQAAIGVLGTGGRLVTITAPRSGSTNLTFDVFSFYRRELSLLGCNTVEYSQAYMARLIQAKLLPLLAKPHNDMPRLDGTTIRLDQAADAYGGQFKKAVILFDD